MTDSPLFAVVYSPLLAGVYIHDPLTPFTLDIATPVELAVTPFHQLSLEGVVASAAAHQVAAVHPLRVPVTHPANSSQ